MDTADGRTRPEVLAAFEENLVTLLRLTAAAGGEGFDVRPDLVTAVTGVPAPPFNVVTWARLERNIDQRIEEVVAAMDATGLPWSWWIGPTSRPADLSARLRARGFEGGAAPAMALELGEWRAPAPASGIDVGRVRDAAGFHDASVVAGLGFEMSDEVIGAFERLFGDRAYADDSPMRTYVARIGRRPVATAAVLRDGAVAGVYNVATVPDARGLGAGTAVTAAALADARRQGSSIAILESSDMGRGVYERLGFVAVTTLDILVRHGPSTAG